MWWTWRLSCRRFWEVRSLVLIAGSRNESLWKLVCLSDYRFRICRIIPQPLCCVQTLNLARLAWLSGWCPGFLSIAWEASQSLNFSPLTPPPLPNWESILLLSSFSEDMKTVPSVLFCFLSDSFIWRLLNWYCKKSHVGHFNRNSVLNY